MIDNYLTLRRHNIEVRYIEGDEVSAEETFIVLKEVLVFLSKSFCLRDPFPPIRAILVPNRSEYERLVINLLGVDIEIPSNPARIAQPQKTDIVFLSPSAYKEHSVYEYNPDEYRRLVFHELTHVFEEYLTPDIETTPRWWSEGLAVYLLKQWKYEDKIKSPVLQGCKNKKIPDLKRIEKDIKFYYQRGWTIVMFIERTYGTEMILRIVKECNNGNVLGIIGEDLKDFEKRWKKWLLESWENSANFA